MYCRLKKLNENNWVLRCILNLINYVFELCLKYKILILLIFCFIVKKKNCLYLYYICKIFIEKRLISCLVVLLIEYVNG